MTWNIWMNRNEQFCHHNLIFKKSLGFSERKYIDIEVLSDYAITSINMKIGRSEYDDGGQYKILAKNKYGEAEYLLDLRVQSKFKW